MQQVLKIKLLNYVHKLASSAVVGKYHTYCRIVGSIPRAAFFLVGLGWYYG